MQVQDTGTVEATDRPRGGPQVEGRKKAGLETSEVLVLPFSAWRSDI